MIPLIIEALEIRKAVKMAKSVKKNPVKRKEQRASGDLFDAVKAVKKAAAPKRKPAPKKTRKVAATKPKKARASGRNRPRVTIVGNTAVFGEKSPWKGLVTRANPGARVLLHPCKIELSKSDLERMKGKKPSAGLIADILEHAATSAKDWDHIEVVDVRGNHLFDLA